MPGPGSRIVRRIARLAASITLAAAALLACVTLLPGLAGFERYVITSGSMTGSYDRGSIVFDEVVPVEQLRVGDAITYKPPAGEGPDHLITHRIASIERDRGGARVFRTKGDANRAVDPWTFRLDQPTQARVAFHIPYAGYALAALSREDVRRLAVAAPAALIALMSLLGLWRALGAEAEKRRTEAAA
jgi:signal peptidase I